MELIVDPAGFLTANGTTWPIALGRGGISNEKREGDGATPSGIWRLGRVFYRADRVDTPQTGLRTVPLQPNWGWCDDPDHPDYNTLITLPHTAHHEDMWREDALYDVVVEILYNSGPTLPGAGSAIFMHVAKPDFTPTEGCIALNIQDLLGLLRLCNDGDVLVIPPQIERT